MGETTAMHTQYNAAALAATLMLTDGRGGCERTRARRVAITTRGCISKTVVVRGLPGNHLDAGQSSANPHKAYNSDEMLCVCVCVLTSECSHIETTGPFMVYFPNYLLVGTI